MQNQFQTTVAPFVGSSRFDLGHEVKCSTKIGVLKPDLIIDTLPGDIFQDTSEYATRFEALLSPMMHRVNLYSYFFFVPSRLVWRNFKYWICGELVPQDNGDLIEAVEPTITIDSSNWQYFKKGTLADYLGIPVPDQAPVQPLEISAMPFRVYQFIYNEYFRNQELEPDLTGIAFSANDTVTEGLSELTKLRFKWWEKDYFTSSFLSPQQGPPVQIPVSANLDNIRIMFDGSVASQAQEVVQIGTSNPVDITTGSNGELLTALRQGRSVAVNNAANLYLENAEVSAGTIADLLTARMLQNFLNLSKRGGERYIEQLKAHFGVTSSDARLQRPQFLGGGKSPVQISEVMQTSETTETSPLGAYAGRAVAFGANHGFDRHFVEEHGWIMGLSVVYPRSSYQQGLERMWSRRDRLDYYWPSFAHLQEQPVLNQELFVNWQNISDAIEGGPVSNEGLFGYQARYMEYRTKTSRVAGEFRDTLSYWHMGRIFDRPPRLSVSFASMRDSTQTFLRPFAVQDGTDYVYQQIYHNLVAIRKLPKYVYPKF